MRLGSDPASRLVLSPLEQAVLVALACGIGEDGGIIEEQVRRARVSGRTHSGVGFVTRLEVPEDVEPLPPEAARRVRPVLASHPDLAQPAEFLVQLKAGRLASIEAYCHEGTWPADDARFSIPGPRPHDG
jgi:hypothetical protein